MNSNNKLNVKQYKKFEIKPIKIYSFNYNNNINQNLNFKNNEQYYNNFHYYNFHQVEYMDCDIEFEKIDFMQCEKIDY